MIKHDKKAVFKFASLQSETGQRLLSAYGLATNELSSFVLIEDNKAYLKSTAALRVSRKLDSILPVLYLAIIIPAFIRDAVYNYISQHRYKWFGKLDECWLPTEELRERFILILD